MKASVQAGIQLTFVRCDMSVMVVGCRCYQIENRFSLAAILDGGWGGKSFIEGDLLLPVTRQQYGNTQCVALIARGFLDEAAGKLTIIFAVLSVNEDINHEK